MGILADTIEEVQKLPPAGKLAVGVGGAALVVALYLHGKHVNGASGGSAGGIGLSPSTDYGAFGVVPGGPPSSSVTSGAPPGGTVPHPVDMTPDHGSAAPPLPPKTTTTSTPPKTTSSGPTRPAGYSGPQSYTVKSGDYLSAIASRYGVPGGWQAIYNLNRGVIGSNPNLIYPGQVLRLF